MSQLTLNAELTLTGFRTTTTQKEKNAHKTLNETLNLPTQNGHALRSLTFLNDSITGSSTFLERKTSQYALPTNPTRSDKSYAALPRSANALARDKCPLSHTGLCLRTNVVYQLTNNNSDQQRIGSTYIHT